MDHRSPVAPAMAEVKKVDPARVWQQYASEFRLLCERGSVLGNCPA